METYTVRDENGKMIMQLTGSPAENIIKNIDGEWRTYQPKDGERTVCYEIKRDSVWEQTFYSGAFKIYLWKGTILIKD